MFRDVGEKIKVIIQIVFWVGTLVMLIAAIALAADTEGKSIFIALIAEIALFISSCFLYGFGEIICKLELIEWYAREKNLPMKSDAQIKKYQEETEQIEELRAKGFITDQEYRDIISRKGQK